MPPPGPVSETVFAPAVPAGVTAEIVVEFTMTTLVTAIASILMLYAPRRFVPEIVIAVPPATGPAFGETDAIVGCRK